MCLYLRRSFNQCWARCCRKVIWLPQNEGVYRSWWAFAQDYMFWDEQNTSLLCSTGLCLILMFSILSVNRAERTNSERGWKPCEHSQSDCFFLPLCVNLGSKHLESVQHEKARRAFSTCATWLQIHLMHWKGCGFLLRYSESNDEQQIGLRPTSGYLACLVIILLQL